MLRRVFLKGLGMVPLAAVAPPRIVASEPVSAVNAYDTFFGQPTPIPPDSVEHTLERVTGLIKNFRERDKRGGRRQRDFKNARFGRGDIDGDIAAMKSFNWHTKQRLQREREVQRAMRQAATWNYDEIMDLLDINPVLRTLIPDIPTEDEL